MNNDFENLSKTWEQQEGEQNFDLARLKRRLFVRKAVLITTTVVEVVIILALVVGIIVGSSYQLRTTTIVWMLTVLVIALAFTPAMIKSRFKSYQLMDYGTDEWVDQEIEHSQQIVYRCKLTHYFLLTFGLALGLFLGYEYFVLNEPLRSILLRLFVASVVIILTLVFNQRIRSRHVSFLSSNPRI